MATTNKKTLQKINSFNLNQKNIDALGLETIEAQDIPLLEAEKGFGRNAIYYLATMSRQELETRMKSEEPKELIKKFSRHWYGASALHWAMLNPDTEILKTLLTFFDDKKINIEKLQYTIDRRKTKFNNNFMVHQGDSLFNLAFAMIDKEKMKILIDRNLASMNCPTLLKSDITYFNSYYYENLQTYKSNILDYCSFLIYKGYNTNMKPSERNRFYFDFAFSFKSADELLGLEEYRANVEKNTKKVANKFNQDEGQGQGLLSQYLGIIHEEKLYDSENFIKLIIPALFKDFKINYGSRQILDGAISRYNKLEKSYNWVDCVVINFLNSKFSADKEAQKCVLKALQNFKEINYDFYEGGKTKKAKPIKEIIDNAISLLNSGIEKKLLISQINQQELDNNGKAKDVSLKNKVVNTTASFKI